MRSMDDLQGNRLLPTRLHIVLSLPSQLSLSMKDDLDQLNRHKDNQERQAILDWLTPTDYALQQSDFIAKHQEGTGQWFLDSNEFQKWLNGSTQTLLCPGMPGAGKTIITSTVLASPTSIAILNVSMSKSPQIWFRVCAGDFGCPGPEPGLQ
jgi:hypothetical protein